MNEMTILIPTYNRLSLLRRCLCSVSEQTNRAFDLIIIDNDSTDGTKTHLKGLSNIDNYKILLNERNLGAVTSIARGLAHVKTKWVTILCDDDLIDCGFVDRSLRVLTGTSRALVVCGFRTINEKGNVLSVASPLCASFSDREAIYHIFGKRQMFPIAGISGFFLNVALTQRFFCLKEYSPQGYFTDSLLCYQSIFEGGLESFRDVIYSKSSWSFSETAQIDWRIWNLARKAFYEDLLVLWERNRNRFSADEQRAIEKGIKKIHGRSIYRGIVTYRYVLSMPRVLLLRAFRSIFRIPRCHT